jgi:hypothetical protein
MSDFPEQIGRTLTEIERTKRMAGAPDRVASYLTPLYTSLVRDIMSEIKHQVKEELIRELKQS